MLNHGRLRQDRSTSRIRTRPPSQVRGVEPDNAARAQRQAPHGCRARWGMPRAPLQGRSVVLSHPTPHGCASPTISETCPPGEDPPSCRDFGSASAIASRLPRRPHYGRAPRGPAGGPTRALAAASDTAPSTPTGAWLSTRTAGSKPGPPSRSPEPVPSRGPVCSSVATPAQRRVRRGRLGGPGVHRRPGRAPFPTPAWAPRPPRRSRHDETATPVSHRGNAPVLARPQSDEVRRSLSRDQLSPPTYAVPKHGHRPVRARYCRRRDRAPRSSPAALLTGAGAADRA
ncbi:hypothetical protein JOF36_002152 [Pseudonocardia parietis]|uniref:Basic proline-rich protein n=1 Tax=Pseudonocardia parietis TaxID=570936 RepID=A0ABS4VRA9_9PSEU|nr:hypothetical protein [Pseudonocardia parietis]